MDNLSYYLFDQRADMRSRALRERSRTILRCRAKLFVRLLAHLHDEGPAILERTIIGAKYIHHGDIRIWVLDDGARPWVQQMAAELEVEYVSRVKGKHAKAGNINNGLQLALSTGRPPEFILLLDADFVPFRNILRRTLGFFEDTDVGIVQTPQHFFNRDPIQTNLLVSSVWPDEQRFFFNVFMPCRDAWGAAFCCGTSAVIRVAALRQPGGIPTDTVTEDLLTTFKLKECGYRTIFLNERLSMGLAPESLSEFITQRERWCLGTLQQVYTRWSFFGRARVGVIYRIGLLDSVLYWISGAIFKLMILLAPMVFWFTGTAVIRASVPDLIYWLAPAAVTNFMFALYLSERMVLPVIADITQLLTMFAVARTVVTGLFRPFNRRFKVTSKGLSSSAVTVHWTVLSRFVAILGLTLIGLLLHISSFSPLHGEPGYTLTAIWSVFDIALLFFASVVCVEPPKRRFDERFSISEPAVVLLEKGRQLSCRLQDLSLGGACLIREEGWRNLVGPASLVLCQGGTVIPFDVVRRDGRKLALQFHWSRDVRRALTVHLFTGAYHQDVENIGVPQVFRVLGRVLIS